MPKVAERLTDKKIESAKPEEKEYRLYDGEGLCLLVRTSGTKVWQYPYVLNGKRSTYTIGHYHKGRPGSISLKKAREKRHQVRALVEQGIDPNVHKSEQLFGVQGKQETTFEALGREWHSKGVWVPKHAKNILRSLEDDVFPVIGHLQFTEITRQDIVAVIEAVEQRGAIDVAKRIAQRCSAIFDYAIGKGVCDKSHNPALRRFKFSNSKKRKPRPFLREHQLPELLNSLDAYHGRDFVKLGMKLLILTFVRPGELRHGRWDEIDFRAAKWRIPAHRMKMDRDHTVPLSKQALVILEELEKITGNNELLFPSIKNNQKPISDVTFTKVLKTLGYTKENKKHVVPHGFRHTASTILNEHGHNRDHIEKQLAHAPKNKMRSTYNHAEYMPQRKKMMQWYADHLDELRKSYVA